MSNEIVDPGEVFTATLVPVKGQDLKIPSRAEIQRRSATDIIAAGADEVFGNLFGVMGSVDISQVRPLVPSAVNELATELLLVRSAQDILTGRADALKKYATDVINLELEIDGKDPQSESGHLYSSEYKIKLSKEVTGNKLNVDPKLLQKILEPDQFEAVTNEVMITKVTTYPGGRRVEEEEHYYEINEPALEKELQKGNIGMEQIVKAAVPGKARTAFYVRNSK